MPSTCSARAKEEHAHAQRGGRRAACSGRVARESQRYPRELCRAIRHGIRKQMKQDNLINPDCFGVQVANDEEEIECNLRGPEHR